MKQLRHTTVIKYSSRQAWNAVLRRSADYRLSTGGVFKAVYAKTGEHYEYYASYDLGKQCAIQALMDIEAIDLTPADAYQKVMGGC